MTVFEFVLAIVLISTVGKVITEIASRGRAASGSAELPELDELRDTVGELSSRVHTLEEERDFYRALLEAPRSPDDASAEAERPSVTPDPLDSAGR